MGDSIGVLFLYFRGVARTTAALSLTSGVPTLGGV